MFIDDFSRKTWIYFMASKDQTFAKFRILKSMIENLTGVKIKSIRTDGRGEYTFGEFVAFYELHGIKKEKSVAYSPHQNGLAERRNRLILEKTCSMLLGARAPAFLWAEASKTAIYLLNRSPTKANTSGLLEERFTGIMPSMKHLRAFGCLAYVHILEQHRNKLDSRYERGVFVGYDDSTKGYRVYLSHKRTATINQDVTFDESRVYKSDPLEAQFDIQKLLELRPTSSTMSHAISNISGSAPNVQTPSKMDLPTIMNSSNLSSPLDSRINPNGPASSLAGNSSC
jgi:hypothetical protein